MNMYTSINYPESLPCPTRENHSFKHQPTFIRTSMDNGRARNRRKFSFVPTMAKLNFEMTNSQFMAFEAWYRDQLADGVKWFNMNLVTPIGDETPVICRFVDMYGDYKRIGVTHWEFSCEIEIYERPLLPEGYGLIPELVMGFDAIDHAVNEVLP